ncbi:MAG: metallophosphoesterase [Treponema sp.]|nr:metallophosphoesterase [Treponema sp.]
MVIKRYFLFFSIVFTLLCCTSCYGSWNPFEYGNNVDNRIEALPDISETLPDSVKGNTDSYTVLVFADSHFDATVETNAEKKLFKWLDSLDAEEYPRFAISLGDSTNAGTQSQFDEYLAFCNKLETNYNITTINVPGNHDIYCSNWKNWKKNCFPYKSFYCFKTQSFSWYALDTASGSLGLFQYNQLKNAMENDPNPKIVFSHYPIIEFNFVFGLCDTVERNLLLDLFVKNNVKLSLGGHLHNFATDKLQDYTEYCLPSFRYNEIWTLLTINENTKETKVKIIE